MALHQFFRTSQGFARRVGEDLELISELGEGLVAALGGGRIDQLIQRRPLSRLALAGADLSPVTVPRSISLIGFNYASHAEEAGFPVPTKLLFASTDKLAVSAPGSSLVLPTDAATMVDYEAELGIVVGAEIFGDLDLRTANAAVAGVCAVNDFTARDKQMEAGRKSPPDMDAIVASKAYPGFKPIGPGLLVLEGGDWGSVDFSLQAHVNGELRQSARISDMVFSIPEVVAAVAASVRLLPGDLICTGTPAGVGLATQRFLRPGDVVEITLGPLPPLRTLVQAQLEESPI